MWSRWIRISLKIILFHIFSVPVGNSLRRFGQSIKRIVREVEEQSQGKVDNSLLLFSSLVGFGLVSKLCLLPYMEMSFPNQYITYFNQIIVTKHMKCKPLLNI